MSHQDLLHAPTRTRRQEARDLQARLYREIGLAAVAAELFAPERSEQDCAAPRGERAAPTLFHARGRVA